MNLTIIPTPEFKKSVNDLENIDDKRLIEILLANGLDNG
jgi:hypothetical protein